jgi:hypothetical protein
VVLEVDQMKKRQLAGLLLLIQARPWAELVLYLMIEVLFFASTKKAGSTLA